MKKQHSRALKWHLESKKFDPLGVVALNVKMVCLQPYLKLIIFFSSFWYRNFAGMQAMLSDTSSCHSRGRTWQSPRRADGHYQSFRKCEALPGLFARPLRCRRGNIRTNYTPLWLGFSRHEAINGRIGMRFVKRHCVPDLLSGSGYRPYWGRQRRKI